MPHGSSASVASASTGGGGGGGNTDFTKNTGGSSWKFSLSSVVNIMHRKRIQRSTGRNTTKTCASVGDDISYQNEYNKFSASSSASFTNNSNNNDSNTNSSNNNGSKKNGKMRSQQAATTTTRSKPSSSSAAAAVGSSSIQSPTTSVKSTTSLFSLRKRNKYRRNYKRNRRRSSTKKNSDEQLQQQQQNENGDGEGSSLRSGNSLSGKFSIRSVPTGGIRNSNSYSGSSSTNNYNNRRSISTQAFAPQSSGSMLASGKQQEMECRYDEALDYYLQALDISQKQITKKYERQHLRHSQLATTTYAPDNLNTSESSMRSRSTANKRQTKPTTTTSAKIGGGNNEIRPSEINYTSLDSSARRSTRRRSTSDNTHNRISKLSTAMMRKSMTPTDNMAIVSIDSSLKGLSIVVNNNNDSATANTATGDHNNNINNNNNNSTSDDFDHNCDNHHLLALWFLVLLHIKMSLSSSLSEESDDTTNTNNQKTSGKNDDTPTTNVKPTKTKAQKHHRSEVQSYLLRLYQHINSDRLLIPDDWLIGLDDKTSHVLLDVLMEINYYPLALRLAQFINVDDRRIKYEMIKGGSFTLPSSTSSKNNPASARRRKNDNAAATVDGDGGLNSSSAARMTFIEKLEECRGSDDIDLEKRVLLSLTRAYGQSGSWEKSLNINTELMSLLVTGVINKQQDDNNNSSNDKNDNYDDDDNDNCNGSDYSGDDEDFYKIYNKDVDESRMKHQKSAAATSVGNEGDSNNHLPLHLSFSDGEDGVDSSFHGSTTSISASSSEFYQALTQRAEIYLAQGQQDMAWRALKRAVRYSKKDDRLDDHDDDDHDIDDDKSDTTRETHDGLGSVVHIQQQEEDDYEVKFLQAKAELLYHMGYLNDSLVAHGELLEYLRKNKSPICPEVAKTLYAMGRICIKARNYAKAVQYYTEELQVTKLAVGTTHVEVSRILHEIGKLYDNFLGDYARALRYYQKAYKVEARLLEECIQQEKSCHDCVNNKKNTESSTPANHQIHNNHHNSSSSCPLHSQKYHEIYTNIKGTQQCIGRIHYKLGDFSMALKTSFPDGSALPGGNKQQLQQKQQAGGGSGSGSADSKKAVKHRFSFTSKKKESKKENREKNS